MANNLCKKHIGILILALGIGIIPAFGADFNYGSDGSASNNIDLLRGSYETGCYYPAICGGLLVEGEVEGSPSIKSATQTVPHIHQKNSPQANVMLKQKQAPLSLIPLENNLINYQANIFAPNTVFAPSTTFDWSVSLRGAYRKDYDGERFETILTPNITITHRNKNAIYNLGAQASLAKASDSEFTIRNVSTEFGSILRIDKETSLSYGTNAQISQEDVNSLGLANNVISPPAILNLNANAAISREFGRLTGELRLGYDRDLYSNTGLVGGLWQNNSARNRNSYSAGLRLTQEITPIIAAYIDLEATRNIFDTTPTIGLATTQNNWALNGRTGLSGNWSDVILADISAGYALRQFDSTNFADSPAITIDASLIYRNKGLDLSTNFATDITTPDPSNGASLRVGYLLGVSASYQVNDWLRARASAGGNWASFVGSNDIERSYFAGVGIDYNLNRHVILSSDYTYNIINNSATTERDSHRFELGLTYSR